MQFLYKSWIKSGKYIKIINNFRQINKQIKTLAVYTAEKMLLKSTAILKATKKKKI